MRHGVAVGRRQAEAGPALVLLRARAGPELADVHQVIGRDPRPVIRDDDLYPVSMSLANCARASCSR